MARVKRPMLKHSRYRYWFVVLAGVAGGYCIHDQHILGTAWLN